MKVLCGNNCEYLVVFFKTKRNIGKSRKGNPIELIDTHCKIFWKEEELAHTVAKQNALDSYNKIVGKKIAMSRAIDRIPALSSRSGHSRPVYVKSLRKDFWDAFQEQFKRWN